MASKHEKHKSQPQFSGETQMSLMSGSTSTPTPIVKKESDPGDIGTVHKKDAIIPDGHVEGTHKA